LKKMAEPYMPAIAGALGIGFPMDQVVWLEATVLEPGLLCEYFLFQTENAAKHIQFLRKQGYRFINGGADIATGTGPVVSPGAFQAIFVPALRRLADECRKHGMMYCYRTDGNTWKIADSLFLDAGIQAYGEVDRDASMTVGRLRSRYPGIFILGNVSSAALSTCSEEEIRRETRATLEEAGGSHYIAGPSNAVVHGTPVNNLLAMIDEVMHYKL
jgi:uroporphyrinogen-III decarboxylase